MRYAVYFTPPRNHPLTRLASTWIGRDAFSGEPIRMSDTLGLQAGYIPLVTAPARRYGFHATLKAPFELGAESSAADLARAADVFVATIEPFVLPRLRVTVLDGFLALTPETACEPLDALAADTVIAFDRFRRPLSDADFARRNPDRLTTRQVSNLQKWGYPHVFEDFRFHMTLTGPLVAAEASTLASTLEDYLAPALAERLTVDAIAIFVEDEAGAPFRVLSTHSFGARAHRRSA
jgi:putative phosphonate metabolism protein